VLDRPTSLHESPDPYGAEFRWTKEQEPGVYSVYEIDESGGIKFDPELTDYYFTRSVIFQYSGNEEEKFRDEVDALATSHHDIMNLGLQTNSGHWIRNWD
jgi:hypothetical protein